MTTVSNAILALHDAALRAKYLAEVQSDSRLFHLRRISDSTALLASGMPTPSSGGPVFSSARAPVCHLTQQQAARAANAIMGRRA